MPVFSDDIYENQSFIALELEHDLEGIEFDTCVFKNASFQSRRFVECSFDGCEFVKCNLSLVEIVHTSIVDAKFIDCKMIGISWGAISGILSASYEGCILNNNIFADMNLTKFAFTSCTFVDASFYNTKLNNAVFSDCDMKNCQFSQTDLSCADFTTSKNYYMNATTNTLHKAKFSLPEAVSLLGNLDIELT